GYSMRSDLARLWRAQRSWTFSATIDDPPLEKGRMWSKWRLSPLPHATHCPRSRFQTASFTSDGITRLCSRSCGVWRRSASGYPAHLVVRNDVALTDSHGGVSNQP